MRIDRFAPGAARLAGRGAARGVFRLPDGSAEAVPEAASVQQSSHIGALGVPQDGVDRRVERRVGSMLDELGRLQLALLDGEADPQVLARLAQAAEGEAAADPVLAEILAGVALRARVEIARRQREAGTIATKG